MAPLASVGTQQRRLFVWFCPGIAGAAFAACWAARRDTAVDHLPCRKPLQPGIASGSRSSGRRRGRLKPREKLIRLRVRSACDWRRGEIARLDCEGVAGPDSVSILLIARPAAVLASLGEIRKRPRPEDTGLPQLVELFRYETERRAVSRRSVWQGTDPSGPVVVDCEELWANPTDGLRRLCDAVRVRFDPAMTLSDAYPRFAPTDGLPPAVHEPPHVKLPAALRSVWGVCQPLYEKLYAERL